MRLRAKHVSLFIVIAALAAACGDDGKSGGPDASTDADGDTDADSDADTDTDANARVTGAAVDMGAYEFQP